MKKFSGFWFIHKSCNIRVKEGQIIKDLYVFNLQMVTQDRYLIFMSILAASKYFG